MRNAYSFDHFPASLIALSLTGGLKVWAKHVTRALQFIYFYSTVLNQVAILLWPMPVFYLTISLLWYDTRPRNTHSFIVCKIFLRHFGYSPLVYTTDHLLPTNFPPKSLTLKVHFLNSFSRAGGKIWSEMSITHCKIFRQMHLKENKKFIDILTVEDPTDVDGELNRRAISLFKSRLKALLFGWFFTCKYFCCFLSV